MKIIVIDAQGGGIGRSLVAGLRQANVCSEIIAAGTNAIASSNMLKAGANAGASGENAIVYNARRCTEKDIIAGPIGIILANSMHGEISPAMAGAVSESDAVKVLIPSNKCPLYVAGIVQKPLPDYIDDAIQKILALEEANE